METKDQVSMAEITPRAKKDFLRECLLKHKELSKFQREYKKVLSMRLMKRSERILEQSYLQAIESLQSERNDLRAQIWVANGPPHFREDKRRLQQIECHVECQERLSKDIKSLKVAISNLERQKGITDKQIYELNRRTVPDTQHQAYVERARRKLTILENHLEVGVRRECKFTAVNAEQREEMKSMLDQRERFNDTYTNLVQTLNVDRKYLMDLLEYATNAFEGGIDLIEKMANTRRKSSKESEQAKLAVQSVMRNVAAAELVNSFFDCKNYARPLAELQPVERRRREKYKRHHLHRISLYNRVIAQTLEFSHSQNIHAVIDKYRQQQSLYYTYFTYANETSHHITFLQTAVNRLFTNVKRAKLQNRAKSLEQEEKIEQLEEKLQERLKRNKELNSQLGAEKKRLQKLLEGIKSVFETCLADGKPMLELLGDQDFVNLFNMRGYLKILEDRVLDIVRSVYIAERCDLTGNLTAFTVRDLEKFREFPTDIDNIVLTQQCPECAEGETFNVDDAGEAGIAVTTLAETKEKLFETVNQPDMQYRLHSISHCRLPRSRALAWKKHI